MKRNRTISIALAFLAAAVLPLLATGCMRPYSKPQYVEINHNQTAFVVPLDQDNKSQIKLDSAQAYEKKRVMEKRIQITKRWRKSNYEIIFNHGEWIPNIRVYVVDRESQSRLWTAEKDTGTAQTNQALWLESQDGVKFSAPINCIANVLEDDASTYLYFYPNAQSATTAGANGQPGQVLEGVYISSLATVMDAEVWEMCQVVAAEFAFQHPMDELRSLKSEMNASLRDKIVPFFKKRGINITTLGIAGDFFYANEAVQKAIDGVFTAQQLENVEKATLDSMESKIARMTAEGISAANQIYQAAIGEADAIRTKGDGEAAAIISASEGQAAAIMAQVEACKQAENNPLFLQTKELQIEQARLKKWNKSVPRIMLSGTGNEPLPLFDLSSLTQQAVEAAPEPAPAAPAK